ncbi:MAG: STAS domain-containing protein [Armatimonadota bacterium]|nr:STAS domain-containing protein [bacterium]
MKPQSFEIATTRNGHSHIVSLSGEIDFAASLDIDPVLSRVIRECDKELLFDLKDVTFIDSEGIKALLSAFYQMTRKRGTARIVYCSRQAMRVIRLAGLECLLCLGSAPADTPTPNLEPSDIEIKRHHVQSPGWVSRQ